MNSETAVFRSLETIERRISEKLTVACLSESVYFSKYHFQHLFRETVGESVMAYVTKRRLTLAGGALLSTDATVLDIALRFGYDSHEHFTRSFKAYMGVTPSEYRKYRLAAIHQTIVKERPFMLYSKTTDELIRALNNFVVSAKETAVCARKNETAILKPFCAIIANKTDALADRATDALTRLSRIAERPDAITDRFAIVGAIGDIAFDTDLLLFNVQLMASRSMPEHAPAYRPLCEKLTTLTRSPALNAENTAAMLNELSSMIFADMRKTAVEKMRTIHQAGSTAIEQLTGYAYIRDELINLLNKLASVPQEDMSVSLLEECLFQLRIIAFSADMDAIRSPKDRNMFKGIAAWQDCLTDAIEFYQVLTGITESPAMEDAIQRQLQFTAFHGNILLFYIRGEMSHEKMGRFLTDAQKAAFEAICERVGAFIHAVHACTTPNEAFYTGIAEQLRAIHTSLTTEAGKLYEHGGAVLFLAGEFKRLADSISK